MSCPFQIRVSGWYFKVMLSAAVFLDMITLQHVCWGWSLWILHIYWSLLMTFFFFPEMEMTTNEVTLQGLEYLKVPQSPARPRRGTDQAHNRSHQRGTAHPRPPSRLTLALWLVGCWEPGRAVSTLLAEGSGAKLCNSLLFKENFPAFLPGALDGKPAHLARALPWYMPPPAIWLIAAGGLWSSSACHGHPAVRAGWRGKARSPRVPLGHPHSSEAGPCLPRRNPVASGPAGRLASLPAWHAGTAWPLAWSGRSRIRQPETQMGRLHWFRVGTPWNGETAGTAPSPTFRLTALAFVALGNPSPHLSNKISTCSMTNLLS